MRIFKNNTEITEEVERYDSSVYQLSYSTSDYPYFASDFPFNHIGYALVAIEGYEY